MTIDVAVTVSDFLPPPAKNLWEVRRDDELAEFGYTMRRGYGGRMTPAVFRWAETPQNIPGDYRVRIAAWEQFVRALNQHNKNKWSMLTGPRTGLFNETGWDKLQLLTMSSNKLLGKRVGDFLRFETLIVSNLSAASGLIHDNCPEFIHRFKNVGKRSDGSVYLADTNQGIVDWPLISKSGIGYIHIRYVRELN